MPLKFCANLNFMFHESDSLLERYTLARNAGFKGVECSNPYRFPVEEVVKAKEQNALEQVLINAFPGGWNRTDIGVAAMVGRRKEFEASIMKSIEYARKLDCRRIHVMSGVTDRSVQEHLTVYMKNMKFAADTFREHDVIGLIEPINTSALPNYFLNAYSKAATVIENLGRDHLKLQLDIFHLQQICGNLTRNIEKFLPITGHVQIAQVPNRNEPNSHGEINYRYVLSLLEDMEYKGWIGLEYLPLNGTMEGLGWLEEYGYSLFG